LYEALGCSVSNRRYVRGETCLAIFITVELLPAAATVTCKRCSNNSFRSSCQDARALNFRSSLNFWRHCCFRDLKNRVERASRRSAIVF